MLKSLVDPAILFFVFGMLAGAIRSNLEIPPQIARFLSLYLLMALGLKGGFALRETGLTTEIVLSLSWAVALAIVIPLISYQVLRRFLNGFDAAALAATYGSVSAVTFITATQFLNQQGVAFGGHMAAAMALMESPAIIIAVLLANWVRQQQPAEAAGPNGARPYGKSVTVSEILHESFTDGAQLLLLGAMLVGLITGAAGQAAMQPFSGELFKGMLSFFLLDMGLLAARNMRELRGKSAWLLVYALTAPVLHALIAGIGCRLLGLTLGDSTLLMVLAASASYIAVPAVLRHAIPEASPSLYFGMSLGLTFPFNILIGIPLYHQVARVLLGSPV